MSGIDRLAEFNQPVEDDDADTGKEDKSKEEINNQMKQYAPIKEGLEKIIINVAKIEKLKEKDRTIANEKQRTETISSLDKIMSDTTAEGKRIKATLDQIKIENQQSKDKTGAKAQMRINLYQTHIRRFAKVMNDYNAASHDFKQNLQDRTRRQLKIVDANITDEDVEKIVSSGQANGVIKKALISENIQDVVRDIEERHLDILKLEKQVQEVVELFKDLATLVDIQQESLDIIENRITNAKAYTERAEVELKHAETYQKKARNKRCCILFMLLAILIAILAPILSSVLGSA